MDRIIKTDRDLADLVFLLKNRKLPFHVSITKRQKRTVEQNKLQRLWLNEAVEELADDTAEGYRAYCKLHFGVPILRNENEDFCKAYDEIIRPLPYHHKLRIMSTPLDWPVTRLMTTKQKAKYLDEMYHHFTSLGARLTEPG